MKYFFTIVAIMILSLTACKSRNAPTGSELQGTDSTSYDVFVGCVPNAGECKNSCPERNGQAKLDESKCDPNGVGDNAGLACFCPREGPPEIPEAPSGFTWKPIGCVRSASECKVSTPSAVQFYVVIDPENCNQAEMDKFLCYGLYEE